MFSSDFICIKKQYIASYLAGKYLLSLLLDHVEDLGLTSVDDGNDRAPEILTASCAKVNIVTIKWEDVTLAEHSIIFNKRFVSWGDVAGENDELSFSTSEGLKSLSNAKAVLTGLCNKAEAADD